MKKNCIFFRPLYKIINLIMPNSIHKASFFHFIDQTNAFFANSSNQDKIELFIEKAIIENPWFTKDQIKISLNAILLKYFNLKDWEKFFEDYPNSINHRKTVGLILPGNIPAVGIHDILMVFASGHFAKIKASSQDKALIELFLDIAKNTPLYHNFEKVDKITGVDAIIATGSDNSAKLFESYFKDIPRIIRGNRSSIAYIKGNEDENDFKELAKDIFTYFGLGCRNVSSILIPRNYNPTPLFDVLTTYDYINDNTKYANNYQYQRTLHVFNGKKHFDLGNILAVEEIEIQDAPIGVINLVRYDSLENVQELIQNYSNHIQCLVEKDNDLNLPNSFYFGKAQEPGLEDFADLINTYEFLLSI